MSWITNLKGTFKDWFLFRDDTVGIGRDGSNNLVFKDGVVSGTKTLTQLLEGGEFQFTPNLVPASETWTVDENKQYQVYNHLTVDGTLVIDGQLVIFE